MNMLFPLICFLLLLLVSNTVSRSPPELHTDNHEANAGTAIRSEVYFNNLTMILVFDDYVKLHIDEHKISSTGMSNEAGEDISVSFNASSGGAKDISRPGSAIFNGGFGILETDCNSVQLNLISASNKSVIIATNNTDVQVEWQSHDRLLIVPIRRENHRTASHAECEVRVRSVEGLKDKVIISIASNDQRVEIDVNYEHGKTIMMNGVWTVFYVFFSIIFCIISIWGICIWALILFYLE